MQVKKNKFLIFALIFTFLVGLSGCSNSSSSSSSGTGVSGSAK
jgi:hypothetical protein